MMYMHGLLSWLGCFLTARRSQTACAMERLASQATWLACASNYSARWCTCVCTGVPLLVIVCSACPCMQSTHVTQTPNALHLLKSTRISRPCALSGVPSQTTPGVYFSPERTAALQEQQQQKQQQQQQQQEEAGMEAQQQQQQPVDNEDKVQAGARANGYATPNLIAHLSQSLNGGGGTGGTPLPSSQTTGPSNTLDLHLGSWMLDGASKALPGTPLPSSQGQNNTLDLHVSPSACWLVHAFGVGLIGA